MSSWHRQDYADAAAKIGETIKAHPMPFLVAGCILFGVILGAILF